MKKIVLLSLLILNACFLLAQSPVTTRQIRFSTVTTSSDTTQLNANEGRMWYDFSTNQFRINRGGTNYSIATGIIPDDFWKVDGTTSILGNVVIDGSGSSLDFTFDSFEIALTDAFTVDAASAIALNGASVDLTSSSGNIAILSDFAVSISAATSTLITGNQVTMQADLAPGGLARVLGYDIEIGSNGLLTLLSNSDNIISANRHTFTPSVTLPGLNVGEIAADPSTLVDGDIWYDGTNNTLDARINGVTISLGAGGGGGNISGALTAPRVSFASGSNTITDDADMTFVTDRLTVTNTTVTTDLKLSSLTATRVLLAGASGAIVDDGDMTFATATNTLTVGRLVGVPTATLPGVNVGSFAGNPSSLTNGDFWNNSSTGIVMFRENSTTRPIGTIRGTLTGEVGNNYRVTLSDGTSEVTDDSDINFSTGTNLLTVAAMSIGGSSPGTVQSTNAVSVAALNGNVGLTNTTSTTNDVYPITVISNSTGTVAAGWGTGIDFYSSTLSGSELTSQIEFPFLQVTAGVEVVDYALKLKLGSTLHEIMHLNPSTATMSLFPSGATEFTIQSIRHTSQDNGGSLELLSTNGVNNGNGGDVFVTLGTGAGSGRDGVFAITDLPNSPPAVGDALWVNDFNLITIGSVDAVLSAQLTLNFADTPSGSSSVEDITVTGAVAGDRVILGIPTAAVVSNGCQSWYARVSAADTVRIHFNNCSGSNIDPGSGIFRVTVFR